MIIPRTELEEIERLKSWIFIFGRRKTGKTFFVKKFLKYDDYFFVRNINSIISEKNGEMIYETFIQLLKKSLETKSTIVIDEFHRLGEKFLDFLHYTEKKGRIILISSTLHLSKELLSSRSPILGLFAEVPFSLPSLKDTLNALKEYKLDKKTLVESAILLREPITSEYFDENTDLRTLTAEIIIRFMKAIPAMIGEIFSEEERNISNVYEGILRAVSTGKVISTEISSHLFSKELISKDNPGMIQQYLKNLTDFGILKKIKVLNKNKFVYKHVSPMAKIFYYADEKYNISERTLNKEEVKRLVDELMPRLVEDNLREFFAKEYGLEEQVCEGKDFDVDACLLKFKKVDTVVEIKWTDKLSNSEVKLINEKLDLTAPKTKILFVPNKEAIKIKVEGLRITDIGDFVN
ncbi:MAG: AAA family ATPase [Nanoarchaeota archaeon]